MRKQSYIYNYKGPDGPNGVNNCWLDLERINYIRYFDGDSEIEVGYNVSIGEENKFCFEYDNKKTALKEMEKLGILWSKAKSGMELPDIIELEKITRI